MKKKALRIFSLALSLSILLMIAACGSSGNQAEPSDNGAQNTASTETQIIKVGSLAALTGYFSSFDIQNNRELYKMADLLNEDGGITVGGVNYKFEIVTADMQSDLAGAVTAAEILAYEEEVDFAIETIGFFAVAASDIFESAGIVHINNWNTLSADEINENTPNKFIGCNSTGGASVALVGAIKEQFPDIKTAVFVTAEDGTEEDQAAVARYACEKYGIELVDSIIYANDIVDMSPVTTRIKSIDADLIIHSHLVANAASVAKALRSSGNDTPIVYIGSTMGRDVVELCGTEAAVNFMTVGFPENADNPPVIQRLYDRVIRDFGEVSFTGCYSNCLYILAEAMKYADSVEPEAVKEALETMDTIETIYGTGTFGGDETYGIAHHGIFHPSPITFVRDAEHIEGYWFDDVTLQ